MSSGLQWLLAQGFAIGAATTDLEWPGDANVTVAIVHLAKGHPGERLVCEHINDKLQPSKITKHEDERFASIFQILH